MLTDEDRDELFNLGGGSPNDEVPLNSDDVFSEYYRTKPQRGMGAWRVISMHYEYSFSSSTPWSLRGRNNGDN